MLRFVIVTAFAAIVLGTPGTTGGAVRHDANVAPGRVVAYAPPVALRLLRAFDPPAAPYGPGHVGVDLRVPTGGIVRSAGAGLVRFAGQVAGRGVVVIAHADGISTEYEPVRPVVARGAAVHLGQPIGVLRGTHRGCPGRCLHWGARGATAYLDPLALLRRLAPVRLLPWPARLPVG